MVETAYAEPPLAAWSSILTAPRAQRMAHLNPDVRLWSVTADDRSYIVRSFGRWRPGAGMVDEYRVLLHLKDAGFPVAVPIVTDAGTLAARDGHRTYVLVPRLAAEKQEELPTGDVCFQIGSAIGNLHAALAQYPWPVRSYEHDVLQQAFDEALQKLPQAVRESSVRPHQAVVTSSLRGLPRQLIHGDCNAGNILVSRGRVSGVIDLDQLRAAMLAAEITLTSWSHVLLTERRDRARPDERARYDAGVAALSWISR